MTKEEAFLILSKCYLTKFSTDELYSNGWYLYAVPDFGMRTNGEHPSATLDGSYSSEELMAIAIWMMDPKGVMACEVKDGDA